MILKKIYDFFLKLLIVIIFLQLLIHTNNRNINQKMNLNFFLKNLKI